MSLVSKIEYRPKIERAQDISSDSVLSMLKDIRSEIANLEPTFQNSTLKQALDVTNKGKYIVNGTVSTEIDLNRAKGILRAYKEFSEGGCQSCINREGETIDAQDASVGWYCGVSDPDYNPHATDVHVRYEGFSPKIKKHYKEPCTDWKPRFCPPLETLILERQS